MHHDINIHVLLLFIQVYSLLIRTCAEVEDKHPLQPFTHVRTPMVIGVAMNAQRRETTIPIGTPPHGGILLF